MVALRKFMTTDRDRWVWLDEGTGATWRKRREELEYSTRALAGRIGTTVGTISNVETGKQRRLNRALFAKWKRALFKDKAENDGDEQYKQLVDALQDADDDYVKMVLGFIAATKGKKLR